MTPRPTDVRAGLPLLAVLAVAGLVTSAATNREAASAKTAPVAAGPLRSADAAVVDGPLAARWAEASIDPAEPAADLEILRRAWLALAGTIPSVEEIRRFEADAGPDRLDRWIDTLLAERRVADHLARRFARALVGRADGQFIVFRRDRFTDWLAERLHANEPFDRVVTSMVADRGLWTESPAVNFVTQAMADGDLDTTVLAGRVSRALLGMRLDCAQCHDHPFAPYTQAQYEGLAACFGQVRVTALGVEDDPARVLAIDLPPAPDGGAGPRAMQPRTRKIPPRVPFGAEWWTDGGSHRENLAAWIVDPRNRRFHRAVVNRAWGIVFGRPWHEPADDLPDPPGVPDDDDPLDRLAGDFCDHGCDLRRLLATLTRSRLFRLSSRHPLRGDEAGDRRVDEAWAAYPITPAPPETLITAMVQATSLRTIDRDSHLLTRTIRFFREVDFLRDYGVTEDANGRHETTTVPQALVRMNGRLAREMVEANPFTAPGRIAGFASDDERRVELACLGILTRRPSAAERAALAHVVAAAPSRDRGLEDLFWVLMNSAEFGWNH